jgi:hypothetical protein
MGIKVNRYDEEMLNGVYGLERLVGRDRQDGRIEDS